jgi:hypothetical protein
LKCPSDVEVNFGEDAASYALHYQNLGRTIWTPK